MQRIMGPCACTGALWDYVIVLPAPTRVRLFYALKSGWKQEQPKLFLLSYGNRTIDNNEFLVLHEEILPKIPISHTKNMTGFHSKR